MATDDLAKTTAAEAWQTQAARYALLSEVVLLIAKSSDLNRLLSGAINKVKWVIDFERCTLALLNDDEATYRLQTLLEVRRDVAPVNEASVPLSRGIAGAVMQSRQMRLIADLAAAREELPEAVDPAMEDGSLTSVLSLPLQAYGRMLGCITFGASRLDGFDNEDVKAAVAFATHLALAIDRWQQTEALQVANDQLRLEVGERERAEAEAHEAMEAAEDATRAKSDFLAKMSHELRTPLNAIIGYSEMLLEEVEDLGQSEYVPDLQKIQGAGKHLLGLINDILDLSKIEAGRMDLFVEEFDVATMVSDVQSVIAPLAAQNENTLVIDCAPDIGVMHSDQMKVRQNLFNLLSNACKFAKDGNVALTARRFEKEDGDWLEFRVADSGIGMTHEQLEKVFEAFTQADASTTRRFGGTGLGLAITQHFCRMLGGEIAVESEHGHGTTFTITLPAILDAPTHDQPEAESASRRPDGSAGTVLVVDDDRSVHSILEDALSGEGYHVAHAFSGEEGLRMAKEIHPDLVTLDIIMPSKDGWAVLRDLKATPELSDIPVVIVTIMGDSELGYALGAADFVTKPFDTDALLKTVSRHRFGDGKAELLVVDDDSDTRDMLRRILEKDGWSVVEAVDGEDALSKLETLRPRLILLDLMMPKVDGFEVLEALRGNQALCEIPVVVVTAKDVTQKEAERLQGHAQKVFKKGAYGNKELLGVVRDRIAQAAAREQQNKSD
jgi:signal transduction histidine kinase/DNA-binding response OmpR family regulator